VVVSWLLFPLVVLAVCGGCGLAVERLSGRRLGGAVLPALGLAAVIVIATLTTNWAASAPLTPWVVVAVALGGYALAWRRLRALRPDLWLLAAALGIYAICAAPVVLSGNATFLGYFVDSDPAIHFELTSWFLGHGQTLAGVQWPSPSAVANLLHEYLSTAYPAGADVAVGALRPLVGQDIAWVFQPYLAVVMAFAALAVGELVGPVVRSRPLRAACAFIAAQPGLAYAFYLEASVKEIVIVPLIVLTVVLVVWCIGQRALHVRELLPLVVVAVAGLDVYSLAVVPWIGIPLAALVAGVAWRGRHLLADRRRRYRRTVSLRGAVSRRGVALSTLGVLVLAAILTPAASGALTFASAATAVLSQQNVLGNLAAPIRGWEILGIWPNGDFRFPTQNYPSAYVFMGFAIAGAVLGALWLLRRRSLGPLLLMASSGIAALYLLGRSSPYAASKVLMLLSVPVALTAMLGAAALHQTGRRVEGWLLAAAIAFGVLWTNFLAYHDSSVAPQARLRELAAIGTRFRAEGPAFYNLWDTFPVYFLRQESVSVPDTFAGPAPELGGLPPHLFGQPSDAWDPNQLQPAYLQSFRLLVLGRSPTLSRPPADYRLVYQGRYYQVWRRTSGPRVLSHVALANTGADPSSQASCRRILSAAALARREHARLLFAASPALITMDPTRAVHPPTWAPTGPGAPPGMLSLGQSSGDLFGVIHVPRAGRYQVWLEGSFSRRIVLLIAGRFLVSVRHQFGDAGQYLLLGQTYLPAGALSVAIARPASYYAPGNVVGGDFLGPLILSASAGPPAVRQLAAGRSARSLCADHLEWVEVAR